MASEPYLRDSDVTLYHGDALEVLRTLPDRSVHMCATSPPFYGLRDYGTGTWEGGDEGCDHLDPDWQARVVNSPKQQTNSGSYGRQELSECRKCGAVRTDRQIGLEESPDEWVARLVEVFREVRRVLRDDGTLWVEIGDSYNAARNGGWPGGKASLNEGRDIDAIYQGRSGANVEGVKAKDLIGQPWLLAFALRQPYYTGRIKDERDRLWLAAMIDTEGSIGINLQRGGEHRPNDVYSVSVKVHNTSDRLVQRCGEIAGVGSVALVEERRRPIMAWCVYGEKARDLLREVYPHLVAKQHEARLAYAHVAGIGGEAEARYRAIRQLHAGETPVLDVPPPPTMFEPGWYLRSEIIWARPNPMPESVTDRPTKAHSTVFLLSKNKSYFYDQEAIREAFVSGNMRHGFRGELDDSPNTYIHTDPKGMSNHPTAGEYEGGSLYMPDAPRPPRTGGRSDRVYDAEHFKAFNKRGDQPRTDHRTAAFQGPTQTSGANARSVWSIATEPTPFAHFATWPQKLVSRMILAGTSERGVCPECGGPWVRETSSALGPSNRTPDKQTYTSPHGTEGSQAQHRTRDGHVAGLMRHVTTLGWQPSCQCEGELDEDSLAPAPVQDRGGDSAAAPGQAVHRPRGAPSLDRVVMGFPPNGPGRCPECGAVIGQPHLGGCGRTSPAIVLDPFAGSGTTLLVARKLGRRGIGIELNAEYAELASQRLAQQSLFADVAD